jgi:hypothetical protein
MSDWLVFCQLADLFVISGILPKEPGTKIKWFLLSQKRAIVQTV